MSMYEILVPTVRNDGRPFRTRYHRVWDARVRAISGGLTILTPAKGQWVSPDGKLFSERMIPVRVVCTSDQIDKIADMTAEYYDQLAILFYKISDDVTLKFYETKRDQSQDDHPEQQLSVSRERERAS
jgi:hypothetical protein